MKIVGIIAEYNPFHNGHKYQIEYAKKKLMADCVIIAMSGSFTQRGTIAAFDKYTRAQAALKNGADIIFEIPTIFATASAKEYAACATNLLASTKICDTLLFGSETEDINLLEKYAKAEIDFENDSIKSDDFKRLLSMGNTFSKARALFIKEKYKIELSNEPNDILATEYINAILKNNYDLSYTNIKRINNSYNSNELSGAISSATSIRQALKENNSIDFCVPENTKYNKNLFIDIDDISNILYLKLISEGDYSKYADISTDLSNKIKNNLSSYISFSQYCDLLKSKDITYSRISRALCHILLNITKEEFDAAKKNNYNNKLRLLGISENGSNFLSNIKQNSPLEIITKPDIITDKIDIYASEILRILQITKTNSSIPNEYTRKFLKEK